MKLLDSPTKTMDGKHRVAVQLAVSNIRDHVVLPQALVVLLKDSYGAYAFACRHESMG
jgi:hypothetical protein